MLARQIEEFEKLTILGPIISFAVINDVASFIMPRGDGVKSCAIILYGSVVPKIEHHRLPCGEPLKFLEWHPTVRGAEIAAITEMGIVCLQHGNGLRVTLR